MHKGYRVGGHSPFQDVQEIRDKSQDSNSETNHKTLAETLEVNMETKKTQSVDSRHSSENYEDHDIEKAAIRQ